MAENLAGIVLMKKASLYQSVKNEYDISTSSARQIFLAHTNKKMLS